MASNLRNNSNNSRNALSPTISSWSWFLSRSRSRAWSWPWLLPVGSNAVLWFQLVLWHSRSAAATSCCRVLAAGCSTLGHTPKTLASSIGAPWCPPVAQAHSAYAPQFFKPTAPTSWPPSLPPPNTPILPQLEALNIGGSTEQQHWYMDTGASSHLALDAGILNSIFNSCNYFPPHVIAGNGSTLPVSTVGNTSLPHTSLRLSTLS